MGRETCKKMKRSRRMLGLFSKVELHGRNGSCKFRLDTRQGEGCACWDGTRVREIQFEAKEQKILENARGVQQQQYIALLNWPAMRTDALSHRRSHPPASETARGTVNAPLSHLWLHKPL